MNTFRNECSVDPNERRQVEINPTPAQQPQLFNGSLRVLHAAAIQPRDSSVDLVMLVVFAVMVGHACRLICLFNVFCNLVVNVPPPRRDSIMTNTCFNGCAFLAPQTPSLHEWNLVDAET